MLVDLQRWTVNQLKGGRVLLQAPFAILQNYWQSQVEITAKLLCGKRSLPFCPMNKFIHNDYGCKHITNGIYLSIVYIPIVVSTPVEIYCLHASTESII